MNIKIIKIKNLVMFVAISISILISSTAVASAAAKPSFNTTLQYLNVSETYKLKVNNKISGSNYTWTSSNKKIATVSSTGTIKGKRAGDAKITCKITAKSKTYTLTCNVKVLSKDTTYTITEASMPSASIQKKSTYNEYTKDWYLFNEILSYCEKAGGGTIVVEKGTYGICRKVSIPSNVTLILEDEAIIRKLSKTGTSKFKTTKTMFQLVEPSKADKKGVYAEYNGVHDVKIIGKGTATIDLDYMDGAIGFVMGHNQNISFENITFTNMNTGHFIEMDASKDVTVQNCNFIGSKQSPKRNKEAINIDTPDKLTGGFSHEWSSLDKTPVKNLLISDCTFEEIDIAIGTHKYSQIQDDKGAYTITMFHEDIVVKDCRFLNLRSAGFEMIAWKNVTIEDCLFEGGGALVPITNTDQTIYFKARAFWANAVVNLVFKNNTCKDLSTVGGAYSSTGTGLGSASNVYSSITSYITVENIKEFYTNRCSNVVQPTIFLNFDTFEPSDENKEQTTFSRPDIYGKHVLKYQIFATIPEID